MEKKTIQQLNVNLISKIFIYKYDNTIANFKFCKGIVMALRKQVFSDVNLLQTETLLRSLLWIMNCNYFQSNK